MCLFFSGCGNLGSGGRYRLAGGRGLRKPEDFGGGALGSGANTLRDAFVNARGGEGEGGGGHFIFTHEAFRVFFPLCLFINK